MKNILFYLIYHLRARYYLRKPCNTVDVDLLPLGGRCFTDTINDETRLLIYNKMKDCLFRQNCYGLCTALEIAYVNILGHNNYLLGFLHPNFYTCFPELAIGMPLHLYGESAWFPFVGSTGLDKRIKILDKAIKIVEERMT